MRAGLHVKLLRRPLMTAPPTRHRTQAERSERTRELLLDATIACLVELGYARTTVHEICRRAGLSRGAQQHHFTTKADLMTSALEHLFKRLGEEIESSLPPGPARLETGIDLLWRGGARPPSAAGGGGGGGGGAGGAGGGRRLPGAPPRGAPPPGVVRP